jgi:uncharacterized protein (DUF1501 family)
MLDLIRPRSLRPKCDGSTRREFLRIGTLGMFGLTLADMLRLQSVSAASTTSKPKSVILLFLDGGHSQHETFDPKPDAPSDYRSLFGAVPTSLTGIQFSATLPKLAPLAHKMSIVRSLTHTDSDHGGATHWMKTGYSWPAEFLGKAPIIPQQNPSLGSIVARYRGPVGKESGVPTYIRVQSEHGGYPGDNAAWLGNAYDPFRVRVGASNGNEMLHNMELKIDPNRLSDRRNLLSALDLMDRQLDQSHTMAGIDSFHRQAIDVIRGQAKEAFDLSKEDPKLRETYGKGLGEELLLARRLCERGAGFVTLNNGYWDHHDGIVPGIQKLCPPLDQAVAAYIQDVENRGILDDILLVITSEFGRSPRLSGGPGRDHWGALNNFVVIGGGMKMGQIVGASDSKGGYPTERPVTPQDYMATIFRTLGVDKKLQYIDPAGRPRSMVESGTAIEELF